jgi:hypothetical protein
MDIIQNLQLIIHTGPGLHEIADFDGNCLAVHHAIRRLEGHVIMVEDLLLRGKPVQRYIAPEMLTSPQKALEQVLELFAHCQKVEGKVLSVVVFSSDVVSALLNAVYFLDVSANTRVVLHRNEKQTTGEQSYTIHTLDEEACLVDWPYGVLYPSVDEHELASLGFPEALEIHARRERERKARHSTSA